MRRSRRVKIVATLGPASYAPQMIERLFEAGVDVFRINMSHSSFDTVKKLHAAVRAAEATLRATDRHPRRSAGAEVPCRRDRWRQCHADRTVRPSASMRSRSAGGPSACPFPIPRFSRRSSPGHTLLLDDGKIRMCVIGKRASAITADGRRRWHAGQSQGHQPARHRAANRAAHRKGQAPISTTPCAWGSTGWRCPSCSVART